MPMKQVNVKSNKHHPHVAKSIGREIRSLRLKRDMSQCQLADASRVAKSNMSQIENGLTNIRVDTLARIASALRTDMATLVAGLPALTQD